MSVLIIFRMPAGQILAAGKANLDADFDSGISLRNWPKTT
jgi:hypothetical protein